MNRESVTGSTPLNSAAAANQPDMCVLLASLNAEIDLETKNTAQTAIMRASANNKKEAIMSLVKLGGDLNHESHQGDTALSFASKRGIISAVNDLVHCGATVEKDTSDGRCISFLLNQTLMV